MSLPADNDVSEAGSGFGKTDGGYAGRGKGADGKIRKVKYN